VRERHPPFIFVNKPVPLIANSREVYWVPRELMDPTDKKPGRPVVVIEEATGPAGRLRVVSRTRYLPRGGVVSPPEPDRCPRLEDEGRFTDEYTIDVAQFTDPPVRYLGLIGWDVFDNVCAEFL